VRLEPDEEGEPWSYRLEIMSAKGSGEVFRTLGEAYLIVRLASTTTREGVSVRLNPKQEVFTSPVAQPVVFYKNVLQGPYMILQQEVFGVYGTSLGPDVFSYLIGNGDLHGENISLQTDFKTGREQIPCILL